MIACVIVLALLSLLVATEPEPGERPMMDTRPPSPASQLQ